VFAADVLVEADDGEYRTGRLVLAAWDELGARGIGARG
jgi:hypothetical protein